MIERRMCNSNSSKASGMKPLLQRLVAWGWGSGLLLLSRSVMVDAQERPSIVVGKFEELQNGFRTNVCDRQYEVFAGNRSLREALADLNVTVAITNYPHPKEDRLFSLDKNTGGIKETDPGLFVILLDELARRGGFRWRKSYAAMVPLDTTDGNKTWTDMLKWEVTHFDIAADYWGRSQERMALGISFPKGWYDASIILAQSSGIDEQEDGRARFWSFLRPFDYQVWMLIIAAIIFTGLTYFVLERLNIESDERELENKPVVAIFLASLTFTGHFQFCPNTNPARIMSFSWTLWALIVTSAYTANMASFLVSRNNKASVVATLEDALKKGTPVCLQRFSVMDDIIAKKYPDLNIVRKLTEQELFSSLRLPWTNGQGGCGAALTNLGTYALYQGNDEVNDDCSLRSERRVIQHMPAGFATGVDTGNLCTSLISYVINIHMTEMISDGFVAQAWDDHVKKISSNDCKEKEMASSSTDDGNGKKVSLHITEMAGIFVMHLVLLFLAVVIVFVDLRKCIKLKPR